MGTQKSAEQYLETNPPRPRLPTLRHVPAPRPPPGSRPKPVSLISFDVVPENDVPTEPAPARGIPALSSQEAKIIVEDDEARVRFERETIELVRAALAHLQPRPDRGAAIRWLVVGACTGAMMVYVLMAGALHQKDLALAQMRGMAMTPTQTTSLLSPPTLSCPITNGDKLLDAIPTVDVDQLPRASGPLTAHRMATTTKPVIVTTPSSSSTEEHGTVDEENPYSDVQP